MASDVRTRIHTALTPLAAEHGLELWDVELAGVGRRPVVRVFLDREGGVTCDDLTTANTWIGDALEQLGAPAGPFVLEVSSPGIDRTLRGPADYVRFAGEKAEVKLSEAMNGRKTFTGTISTSDADAVTLDVDGTPVRLPHDGISKARLRPDVTIDDEGSTR
jgi:ribosome maturation factor RimP